MFVGEYSNPKLVTMELTSEKDLFLCYRFRCKDGDTRSDPEYEYFEKIKRDQDLMIGYEKLPSLLKDLLSQVGNKDKVGRVNAIFDMAGGECGAATLKFEHDSDFISVPLLLIEFQYIEEENLKNNVAFRINSKKQKTMLIQQRIRFIEEIVQKVNPELFKEIVQGQENSVVGHAG